VGVATGCALESSGGSSDTDEEDGLRTVKVGYLHTVAVDAHMWLGVKDGTYEKHGLKIEPVKFDTGIAESQALTGGSVDVAIMGAVISNFPARGQGKVFLLNDVERETAQLWVRGDSGINSIADLKGKKVATTQGTTAHVFLHNAMKKHGVDPKDITLVNSAMPAAVNSFISGAVPAVALWVPFDLQVRKLVPGAKMIDSAANYYPDAAIMGGWVANNDVYHNDKKTLSKLAAAWLEINKKLTEDPAGSLKIVHETGYKNDVPLDELEHNFKFEETYSNEKWRELYENGDAERWIGQVTRTFVELGGLPEYKEPSTFFDRQIFLDAYKEAPK